MFNFKLILLLLLTMILLSDLLLINKRENYTPMPKSNIPHGDEDLYVLKSSIVPPVCPQCPQCPVNTKKKCSPCPPCGRCPEPSFTCEKVPNYSSSSLNNTSYGSIGSNLINNLSVPKPVLHNNSQFGM